MNEEIKSRELEIVGAFNAKAKNGIALINEICTEKRVNPEEQIALFFKEQKSNLDLEAVGDYLSGHEEHNKEVLGYFVQTMDFAGKSFVGSLRAFLQDFKLPGEAQKIDRLMLAFANRFYEQNHGVVAHQDAAYLLAFQTIMLNTDLHNPSIKPDKKMTIDGLKSNLRGANTGDSKAPSDFEAGFLEGIYKEIKAQPFVLNFTKISPGITIEASNEEIKGSILAIKEKYSAEKTKEPKSFLKKLTGYTEEFEIKENDCIVTVQHYQPGWFSSSKSTVIIQPKDTTDADLNKGAIDFAAKIACDFASPVKAVKACYAFQAKDMIDALVSVKKLGSNSAKLLSSSTNKPIEKGQSR